MENIVLKIKPVRVKKIKVVRPTAQTDYEEWWHLAFDKYISVNRNLIFFYNTESAESEYNAEKTALQAELLEKYQTVVTKGKFENEDRKNQIHSCQAWRPDWDNASWSDLYPPKVVKARKIKSAPVVCNWNPPHYNKPDVVLDCIILSVI